MGGVSFQVPTLISIAFGILVFQLFIILSGAFVDFPTMGSNNYKVHPNHIRIILGDVGSIASIIGLVVALVLLIFGK